MSDIGNMAKKSLDTMRKECLDHCAGRLDKGDLGKLKEMMEHHGSNMVEALEAEVDRKGMNGSMASDSARLAYDARAFGTSGGAVREMQEIQLAMTECAPHLGGRTMAYDSAGAVYREALIAMGHRDKLDGMPSYGKGFQALYRLAARGGAPGPSRIAMDSASREFSARYPDAAKLIGGTGRS